MLLLIAFPSQVWMSLLAELSDICEDCRPPVDYLTCLAPTRIFIITHSITLSVSPDHFQLEVSL